MVVTMIIIGKGLCNVKWSENVGNHHYWSYFFFLCGFSFMNIGLFQKKNRGLRIWNFLGYWGNSKWIFLVLINIFFSGIAHSRSTGQQEKGNAISLTPHGGQTFFGQNGGVDPSAILSDLPTYFILFWRKQSSVICTT